MYWRSKTGYKTRTRLEQVASSDYSGTPVEELTCCPLLSVLTCTPVVVTCCCWSWHSSCLEPNPPQTTYWPHTDGPSLENREPWCSSAMAMPSISPHILTASVKLAGPAVSFAGATTTSGMEKVQEEGQKWRGWRSTPFLCWPPARGWEENTLTSHSFSWVTVWEDSSPSRLPWLTRPYLMACFWQALFCTGTNH